MPQPRTVSARAPRAAADGCSSDAKWESCPGAVSEYSLRLEVARRGSYGPETQMIFHGRKIAVVVQQGVAVLDAEGADYDVGGLADRDAEISQLAIIAGSARSQIGVQERH